MANITGFAAVTNTSGSQINANIARQVAKAIGDAVTPHPFIIGNEGLVGMNGWCKVCGEPKLHPYHKGQTEVSATDSHPKDCRCAADACVTARK